MGILKKAAVAGTASNNTGHAVTLYGYRFYGTPSQTIYPAPGGGPNSQNLNFVGVGSIQM